MISAAQIQTFFNGHLFLYKPQSPLDSYINHIWYVKECNTQGKSLERFLPNASMDLILNLGEEPERILGHHSQSLKHSWISGLSARCITIETPSPLSMMGVEFKAGAAFPFFGFSMSELKESSVELDLIWGRVVSDARDAILESKTEEEKFQLVEKFLLGQLHPVRDCNDGISVAVQMISTCRSIRIRDVASHLGMDHKHFIRRFEDRVGITPKLFSRICRFQCAIHLLGETDPVDLTDVALSCDYFDQSHFIKDFEEFSGMTPGEYLRIKGPFPNWISG